MGRVIVIGSVNVDRIMRVRTLPVPGETVLADSATEAFGGKGANQAVAAAQLGAETWMVGAVGDDDAGSAALTDLTAHGVRVERIRSIAGAQTGQAVVVVDRSGENLIVVAPAANARLNGPFVQAELAALAVNTSDVILACAEIGEDCLEAAASEAARTGARHVLNLAPARPLTPSMCTSQTILIMNEIEATQLSGTTSASAAVSVLLSQVGTVIVTQGARGAILASDKTIVQMPATPVEVVDTTGAGDAFCGAIAAELANGRTVVDAIRTGLLTGAIAVTTVGPRTRP